MELPRHVIRQQEADRLSNSWQKEIEGKYQEIDNLRKKFQAEEVLLTDEMKKKRLAEIDEKEKDAREYQKKVFGFDGMLFKKRQELIKPVQDNMFEAVEKVAKSNRLAIIFDKSGELVMIYTDPRHDYTDFVLEELGLGDPNDKIK